MIAYLKGKIKYHGDDYLVLEVANIGYEVFVANNLLGKIKDGSEIELYTYQYVREDAIDLYGFATVNELRFFEVLNTVSGIGPRSAMGIIDAAPSDELIKAIRQGDERTLVSVYGISQKKAEKIILELKDKIEKLDLGLSLEKKKTKVPGVEAINVIDALLGLGYSSDQARSALRQIPSGIEKPEEMIREALKILGKKK